LRLARKVIVSAQTLEKLRQAQAVVLRRRFMQGKVAGAPDAPTPGGRKRQNMTVQEERDFLGPFLESAAAGGVLVVGDIEAALGKRHPKSDPLVQQEWKNNSPKLLGKFAKSRRKTNPSS
jgi:transposase-like protein